VTEPSPITRQFTPFRTIFGQIIDLIGARQFELVTFALPRLASGKALDTNVISAVFNMLAIQGRVAASW
jgi:hypothetical protein